MHLFRIVILLVFAAAISACGGCSNGSGGDDVAAESFCAVNAERVAERPRCQTDETCPCGTFCDLGRCAAECTSNDECEGDLVCAPWGQCTDSANAGRLRLPSEETGGELTFRSLRRDLAGDAPISVELRSGDEPVVRARLETFEGAQLRCTPDGEWSNECELTDIDAETTITVEVREGEGGADTIAYLEAHTSNGSESMSLFRPAQTIDGLLNADGGAAGPVSGRYQGTIRLAAVGSDRDLENLPKPAATIQMPIEATVWEDGGGFIVQLDDTYDTLTSREAFIGEMTLEDTDPDATFRPGTVDFPNHPFIETTVGGRATVLVAETVSARVLTRDRPRSLSFEIVQRYSGVGGAISPAARWVVEMTRSEGARGLAVSVPADFENSAYDPVQRLTEPTGWEAAFGATVGDVVDMDAARTWYEGGLPPLAMCSGVVDPNATAEALFGELLNLDGLVLGEVPDNDTPFFPLLADTTDVLGVGGPFVFRESASPTLEDAGVPCSLFNMNLTVTQSAGVLATGFAPAVDFCDDLATRTGCTIETIPETNLTGSATGTYTTSFNSTNPATADYAMVADKVCKIPSATAGCAEAIYCMSPEATTNTAYTGNAFDSDPANLARSGDFACAGGLRKAAIEFDDIDGSPSVNEAIRTCFDELEGLSQAPPIPRLYGPGFDDLYPGASCVGLGRLLTAIAAESKTLRASRPTTNPDENLAGAAFSHRLLSRWLQLHGFIAVETNQVDAVRGIFLPGTEGEEQLIDGERARGVMLRGWDVILSQHVLHALFNAPPQVLGNPDYRFWRSGYEPSQVDEPAQPLTAVILDTLARQAGNLTDATERVTGMSEEERALRLGEYNSRAVIALALVADMQARAGADSQSTFVQRQNDSASKRLLVRTSAYSEVVVQAERGGGLVDVNDRNLPLYFQTSSITGATGRFTAISDFIAGSGPGSSAWAPAMVEAAKASLDAARQAFLDESDRQLATARYDRDVAEWASGVRADYNTKLFDYCGPIGGSPVDDPDFDASRCAISDEPRCSTSLRSWYTSYTPDDLMGRFCVNDKITRGTFNDELGFVSPETKAFADDCVLPNQGDPYPVSIQTCANDASSACLRCDADPSLGELELFPSSLEILAETVQESADVPRNLWDSIWSECQRDYPAARRYVPAATSGFEEPECVSGSIGEAYLGIVSAELDMQEARAELAQHLEAYDIAMESCTTLEDANDDLSDARGKHASNMQGLRIAKGAADSAAAVAGGLKDCFSTAASADKSNLVSALVSSGAIIGACVAGAAEVAATVASIGLGAEMERAQQAHDDNVANIEATADVKICFNDAKLELVGSTAASYALERASLDLKTAHASVSGILASAQALHTDGYTFIQESELFDAPSASGDPWVNERINTYTRDFALARRATFLAVRAVEYEFQQGLGVRQAVLEATTPADLEAVLQELWQESGTRSILGSRPTELSSVVSLRDDIFRLSDRSEWPEGTRTLTPSERFHVLLTSERFAAYDANGDYEGQRIPFSLAPLAALGVDAGGVSIYSENDCAERLWSVNASLLGDDLYRGSDTSVVRLDVLKRNTFYSQWCGEAPGDQPFQLATVRPTQNLFRVPGFGEEVGEEQGVEQSRDRFSRARIQAFFGVDRASLENTEYANGETSELAARGLYGDYALFIPASLISRDDGDGLVLDNVDDILLRLDYLSVAKP